MSFHASRARPLTRRQPGLTAAQAATTAAAAPLGAGGEAATEHTTQDMSCACIGLKPYSAMCQGGVVQEIDICPPPSSAQFTDLPVDWCPVINQTLLQRA
jgi:hypothetical protein